MADWVSEYVIPGGTVVKQRRAYCQDLVARCGEVVNLKVKVRLLRELRIRPPWSSVILDHLEADPAVERVADDNIRRALLRLLHAS